MSTSLQVITEHDFEDVVVGAPVPVLVDFFTEWCVPCKALAPTLEALAQEFGEDVRIVSVDAEASPDLATAFEVTGYPTMILFRAGQEIDRPAVRSRRELRAVLNAARDRIVADVDTSRRVALLPAPEPVARLLAQLAELDGDAWSTVEARITQGLRPDEPAVVSSVEGIDQDALLRVQSQLADDVDELATPFVGEGEGKAIGSAVEAAFGRWVTAATAAPTWAGALRAIPAVRMSPYLPSGPAPTSLEAAAVAFLNRLRDLDDREWVTIRSVNHDRFPFTEHKDACGSVSAWLAAVILIQAVTSVDLVAPELLDVAFAPFEGLLDRSLVEG